MVQAHILGFPRVGAQRELKFALESYWQGKLSRQQLEDTASHLRKENWLWQKDNGLDYITAGDFCFYDHILDFSVTLGLIPPSYNSQLEKSTDPLDAMFLMARGRTASGLEAPASEMTKWFDTNYHYLVPELYPNSQAQLDSTRLLSQVEEAKQYGKVKVVIPGLITYLWLAKEKGGLGDRLSMLQALQPAYQQLLSQLAEAGVSAVQIDEAALVQDLPDAWLQAFKSHYNTINFCGMTSLLTSYFESPNVALSDYYHPAFDGYHIDFVNSNLSISEAVSSLQEGKFLSAGVVSGRNIWKADLSRIVEQLQNHAKQLGDRLWVSSSCSLLHAPIDLELEKNLDSEIKNWLAFARQKIAEIATVKDVLNGKVIDLQANKQAIESRKSSNRVHNQAVQQALQQVKSQHLKRKSNFDARQALQQEILNLPDFPTTTIGSFPQTREIRKMRNDFKKAEISQEQYTQAMHEEIKNAISFQNEVGIDLLVHGEAERNDMVEYFGEQLEGFIFTGFGWVQSYGSRCVKPPIIFGDVSRSKPMTVEWSSYAQSLTDKKVKGMLTGPVTILQWSFVRDDQPREQTCKQIALAILAEVQDLEKAGISAIQVDEPALREGLPLRKANHNDYLTWATESFRLATSDVADETQIHTHMCYCEFNDIMEHIIRLDADVISIETSRSQMELLDVFKTNKYPNEIGPGVYDIHSPRVPSKDEITHLLSKAAEHIDAKKLWVNPDCGLKTRGWEETRAALENMVAAAQEARKTLIKTV